MFGYVLPSGEYMSEAAKEQFQGAYCGLCHTLHRRYGLTARMILNYDLAFLAILLDEGEPCGSCSRRCMVHPLKKRPCAQPSAALDTDRLPETDRLFGSMLRLPFEPEQLRWEYRGQTSNQVLWAIQAY